jgi:hypothetical protein
MGKGIAISGKREARRPNRNKFEILVTVDGIDKTYEFTRKSIEKAIDSINNDRNNINYKKPYFKIYILDLRDEKQKETYGLIEVIEKMVEIQGCPKKYSKNFDPDSAKSGLNDLKYTYYSVKEVSN